MEVGIEFHVAGELQLIGTTAHTSLCYIHKCYTHSAELAYNSADALHGLRTQWERYRLLRQSSIIKLYYYYYYYYY